MKHRGPRWLAKGARGVKGSERRAKRNSEELQNQNEALKRDISILRNKLGTYRTTTPSSSQVGTQVNGAVSTEQPAPQPNQDGLPGIKLGLTGITNPQLDTPNDKGIRERVR